MKNNKDVKLFSTISAIFAWILMILLIFALDNTTGNLLKSFTYGLSLGNALVASYVCRDVWKK